MIFWLINGIKRWTKNMESGNDVYNAYNFLSRYLKHVRSDAETNASLASIVA